MQKPSSEVLKSRFAKVQLLDPESPIYGLVDSLPPSMGANAVKLAAKYFLGENEYTHSYICTVIKPISIYNLEWGYNQAMSRAIPDYLLERLDAIVNCAVYSPLSL